MAEIPDSVVLKRDRDLVGRERELWIRRGLFFVLPLVTVLALVNVFGQRPQTSSADAAQARLEVYAPARVRSGLLFGARFTIDSKSDLVNARLVLDPGWLEGMTINTIEPAPKGETSSDGRLAVTLGPVPAGRSYVLYMDFQVGPTNLGRRSQAVRLYDGERLLLTENRDVTVFP